MPKDHFIAQTYLKHFVDPNHRNMLHAYRKSDGATFPCYPAAVCHEWDGDRNPKFLGQAEMLGDFRKIFEPHWNPSVANMLAGKVSASDKFVISAYMANLMTCTPAWRRVGADMHDEGLKSYMSFAKKMKEKNGGQPDLPVEAIELVEQGKVKVYIDPDYIKAVVTKKLLNSAWNTYNQDWTILVNESQEPFITSDSPVALIPSPRVEAAPQRYLPITPKLCLAVIHERTVKPIVLTERDFQTPPHGTIKGRKITTAADARFVNRIVAQCAEDVVFSSTSSPRIAALVKRYAKFRVELNFVEFPAKGEEDAIYQGYIIDVRERSPAV